VAGAFSLTHLLLLSTENGVSSELKAAAAAPVSGKKDLKDMEDWPTLGAAVPADVCVIIFKFCL
jgi:hypothetical protein